MANKKLDQYKGSLTPEQVANGMNAARQNARRLFEDATLLLNAKRFASAASLAILSIEESGKTSILRHLAVAKDDKEIAACWKDYRSHVKKNVAWLLPQLVADGARYLEDFRPLFDEDSHHPFVLDQVKQIGFYTDCLGKTHWSNPENVVDESLATMLIQIAKILCRESKTTVQEIELWVKYLKPVWMVDLEEMKSALANWHAEMKQLGLTPEGRIGMEEFIDCKVSLVEEEETQTGKE